MSAGREPYTFVSLSTYPWSDVWLNRQHIMSRMAREHRVMFCSRIPTWEDVYWALRTHRPVAWRTQAVYPALIDLPPRPWFPRVPPWDVLVRTARQLYVGRIRSALRRRGWDNRILYVWHPELEELVGRFDERLVCFHCYDDYARYTWLDDAARRRVAAQQARLLEKADVVFASGAAMAAELGRDDVEVIANGVDYELFSTAHDRSVPPPPEMAAMPHPIVAHIGRLQMGVDFGLLGEIARRRRDWSVMLLGPIPGVLPPDRQAQLDAFRAEPNAYYIEGKPVAELPRYLRHVDVGLMAYRMEGWIKTAFPLKLFEYCAAGKPAVGPPMDENVRYSDYVSIAETPAEWIDAIERALAEDPEEPARRRMALAKANSWDVRCARILEVIDSRLGPQRTGGRGR